MHEISVERTFLAFHAVSIGDVDEESHSHNWIVKAKLRRDVLDNDGLLCDFHVIEKMLDEIISPFVSADLNEFPPFDKDNPSAERVAEYICKELAAQVSEPVQVYSVSVTEAPGCNATFYL